MARLFQKPSQQIDEENPYWLSFSDLMSAILVVFILAVVALIIELTQTQKIIQRDIQELQNAEAARKDILYEIQKSLQLQDITVQVVDNDTVLRIPETTLSFESNSYSIPKDSKVQHTVQAIGEALHKAINQPFNKEENIKMRVEYLDTIFIEGHTDSVPSLRTKGNWGLSSFRAISLWEYWQDNSALSPSFDELENAYGNKLFSVSGYAATRRLQEIEENDEQRRKNRRIDIRITVKRPSIAELEEIAEK